jgi:hypothetical protein
VGAVLALSDADAQSASRAVGFICFGLFCIGALFFFARDGRFPDQMVFDNSSGLLSLLDRKKQVLGTVPYGGIRGFSVRRVFRDTTACHAAVMDLARGGRWELVAARREEKAQALQAALSERVRLSSPSLAASPVPPGLDEKQTPGGGASFSWRRTTRVLPLVASLVTVVSFCAALLAFRSSSGSVVSSIIVTAFAALFLAAAVLGVLRSLGERFEVSLSREGISWRRRGTFRAEKTSSLRWADLAAIDMSMSFARVETAISFVRPEQKDLFTRYLDGTISPTDIPAVALLLRARSRIDVSALPMSGRLYLVERIRRHAEGGPG